MDDKLNDGVMDFYTIKPTLHSQITYVELAKDLWDDLKQSFQLLIDLIQQLKIKIANCKSPRANAVVTTPGTGSFAAGYTETDQGTFPNLSSED